MASVDGYKEGVALTTTHTVRSFNSNSNFTITTTSSSSQHTQQNQRLTIPPLSKSAMVALGSKRDECRPTMPHFKTGNPPCKPVTPLVLPHIPAVSNFDDLLATFFGALVTPPLADTGATSDHMDSWAIDSNSLIESTDQTQQDTSHTRYAELLEPESKPPLILLDDPSTMMDSPDSLVDPMIVSNPQNTISTVKNTSIMASNEIPFRGQGFAFNTTTASPISAQPSTTRPVRKRLLRPPKWLDKAKNSIHSSSSTTHTTISSRTIEVDTSILVTKSHDFQEHQHREETKDSSIDIHPDTNNSASTFPADNAIQQNVFQQAYSNPVVTRRYRRSVYNAALCDFSPFVSPDGSILHGSSLYQRSGLASEVNTMATRIFYDQAMIRPPTEPSMAAPLTQEKTESTYTYAYYDLFDQAPFSKRTSKALVEDEKTEEDELPEEVVAFCRPNVAQTKQQRRISQRLLDAFRAASTIPSTKATVVHPPMAASSLASTSILADRYTTAWHSWRSYSPPQNSDRYQLNSLQKSLDEIV
ncbi:hypothetical protein [Absidia glauca]|uniref:Uncharacterized protein n=1 Tax=Absidia glauca TaxID=4829 RepID=A0A168LGK6_ABSGL|nr:hypothetical protein [Absidia glauca]